MGNYDQSWHVASGAAAGLGIVLVLFLMTAFIIMVFLNFHPLDYLIIYGLAWGIAGYLFRSTK